MQEKYFYLPKGRSDFFKKRAKELYGSIGEMAKAAKLPFTTVSLILNGYRAPTVRSLKRIAKALSRDGVTVDPMHLTRPGSKKGARK